MKKKILIGVLLVLAILFVLELATQSEVSDPTRFALNECYAGAGVQLQEPDSIAVEAYAALLGEEALPLALNKIYIDHSLKVFAGVDMRGDQAKRVYDYLQQRFPGALARQQQQHRGHDVFEVLAKRNDHFIYSVIFDKDEPHVTVVLDVTSTDSTAVYQAFHHPTFVAEKLTCP